jgi:hypothetical protein
MAYKHHKINQHRKHNCLSAQISTADKTLVLLDMLINTTIEAKGSKSELVITRGHEELRASVMLPVLAGESKLDE